VNTSIFLAKLIGPFFLIVGTSLLINTPAFRGITEEFLNSPALVFLTGLMILPAGLALVLTHNVWTADWRVLITILGWLTVIAGALRLLAPRRMLDMRRNISARANILTTGAAIWLAIGAVLTFFGYLR